MNTKKYRMLADDEIIQNGDEFICNILSDWSPCNACVGDLVRDFAGSINLRSLQIKVRRPIRITKLNNRL